MQPTIYTAADVDPQRLAGLRAAVLGYGNQGQAHALNLRDAGAAVTVGQRPGARFDQAQADGFEPLPVAEAVGSADLLILGLPDEAAGEVYTDAIAPHLRPGQALGFIHGFNVRFGYIPPPPDVDVVMIAPKGPGRLLRALYTQGQGLPALLAVEQDATGNARDTALAWAHGLGCTRAGVLETTFAVETETDLFGEQVVLCGGVSALTKAAFETLVDAGYDPVFAYLECVHELKQVVDLLYTQGLCGMRQRVSNTAEFGDLTRGPRVVGDATRAEMKRILAEIRDGRFAAEWIAEHRAGGQRFRQLFEADVNTAYEQAGAEVRRLMPWLEADG